MRIELASLGETDGRFVHIYETGQLALDDERVRLAGPLAISGKIARSKGKVVVTGQLETRAQIECDRCLKYVELPVQTEFAVEYVTPRAYEASRTNELDEKDLSLSVFDGDGIDIDELASEQLELAVPSRVLCQEGCKGLCAVCGAELNITQCSCETGEADPRWGALKELVNGK
jgi:uncharacterized protein